MNEWQLYSFLAGNSLQAAIFLGANMEKTSEGGAGMGGGSRNKSLCCRSAGTIVNEVFHHNVPAVPSQRLQRKKANNQSSPAVWKLKTCSSLFDSPEKKTVCDIHYEIESRLFRHCGGWKNMNIFFFLLCSVFPVRVRLTHSCCDQI